MNTMVKSSQTQEIPNPAAARFSDSLRRYSNLLLVGAAMVGLAGCDYRSVEQADGSKVDVPLGKPGTKTLPARFVNGHRELGSGVYVFSVDNWPESLASFKKQHPDLRVTAIGPAGQFTHGLFTSFVVNTEAK